MAISIGWIMRRRPVLLTALIVLNTAASLGAEPTAEHDVHYGFGESGFIRAWFIEGPFEQSPDVTEGPAATSTQSRLSKGAVYFTNKSGVLDFNAQFRLPTNKQEKLTASGAIQVDSSVQGWLLLRAEGGLDVMIDGKRQHHR